MGNHLLKDQEEDIISPVREVPSPSVEKNQQGLIVTMERTERINHEAGP
ncbi:hypothetical protein ACPJHQ_20635 [Rossellomorea sp. H39__3]